MPRAGQIPKGRSISASRDYVTIDLLDDGTGSVAQIMPRKNIFIRPPVANIDEFIIVAAAKNPAPDLTFIDKMTVIASHKGVGVTLCINKTDLVDNVHEIASIYRKAGFEVVEVSAQNRVGIEELRSRLKGKVIAFTGFSGVGKSSILNLLSDKFQLETGEVSKKLSRGRHTTRHVELLEYEQASYLVDTPGFSMLDLPDIAPEELETLFPEFEPFLGQCRFRGCSHTAERDCAIIHAVECGEIAPSRYENYKTFYQTLKTAKQW